MGNNYDIDENLDYRNHKISGEIVNTAKNITTTVKVGKYLIMHPGIVGTIVVIIGFLLSFFLIFYLTYIFLFGFSFKLEQGISELKQSAFENESEAHFNSSGYYIYTTGNNEYVFVYKRDGKMYEISLEEALKEAYCVSLMIQEKDLDISTGDTFLLDDSDVHKIMETVIEAEDERKENITKRYVWLSKSYDYGTHEEESRDENGNVELDHMGNIIYVEVKNDYPEWLPNEEWDDSNLSNWFNNTSEVTLQKKDIQGEIDPITGNPRFMVPWQTVVAICEMTSSQGYEDWGNTGDESKADFNMTEYSDMDGYYLNDATVKRIVDALSYDFEFHYNGFEWDPWYGNDGDSHYSYEEMEKVAYRLEERKIKDDPAVGDIAYIKKIPVQAPNAISNVYEHYYYHYTNVTGEYGKKVCSGRSKYVNAVAFVNLMKELAPQFEFDEFIEIIEHFPASEEEVAKYKKIKGIYEWQLETGEPYFVEEDNLPCFSNGVYIGKDCNYVEGSDLIPPDYSPVIGGNYLEGNFEYVFIDGPQYGGGWHKGWYAISEAARKDLSVSDGLSKGQIEKLLNYLWRRTGSNPDTPFYEATDNIFQWQQSGGGSVTGVLGLWIHEGSLTRAIGLNAWNFSNMIASGNEPYYVSKNGRHWTDFKTMYNGDIGAAVVAQFERISRNYWNRNGVKQNTFYAMSFLTQGGIYSAQSEEEVCSTNYFTHCYCPFWDDNGFGVMEKKEPNPAYTGWANGCALYMQQLYSIATGT